MVSFSIFVFWRHYTNYHPFVQKFKRFELPEILLKIFKKLPYIFLATRWTEKFSFVFQD